MNVILARLLIYAFFFSIISPDVTFRGHRMLFGGGGDKWKANRKDKKKRTWLCKTKGGTIRLRGFYNIGSIKNKKKKRLMKRTVDKDSPLLILPSKQVVIMPMIIKPNKNSNKIVIKNQFLV